MLSVAVARRLASGHRHALLDALNTAAPARADVILSTPARFLSARKLTRPNEAIDGMLEVMTTTQAICQARGITCALRTARAPVAHHPKLLLSHHTYQTPRTENLAKTGTRVMHFKAADLPGRTCFDPLGFSGWSSLATQSANDLPLDVIPQATADDSFAAAQAKAVAGNLSKYAQSATAVDLPEGGYVFFALQTAGDMVQRKAFVPMLDALGMVADRFAGTGITLVIKRHPRCRNRRVGHMLDTLCSRPDVMLTTGSIHQILPGAQALFTVNSGVGAEAMIHGCPIYCFGASDYAPVAHQIRNRDALERKTARLAPRLDPATSRRFHHYYRHVYQVERTARLQAYLTDLIDTACTA